MAFKSAAAVAASLLTLASAQQIGTAPEVHPKLPTQRCTKAGGCVTVDTAVVLDSDIHNIHEIGSPTTRCVVGQGKCTSIESCGANCAIDGISDYESMGVFTDGSAIKLRQYMPNPDGTTRHVSPRVYLMAADGNNYEDLRLLNQELTFDVDTSEMVCGMNGALYLSEMYMNGSRSDLNPAGAKYGTGYCDAQCYKHFQWVDGEANLNGTWGNCCGEMDIWEANAMAGTMVPHPCNGTVEGIYKCVGEDECNQPVGVCDKWGCGLNPYGLGSKDFYGRNKTVNTNKKITVVTQFITDDGTSNGTLVEIKRLYVQDGKVIEFPSNTAGGVADVDSLTTPFCAATASFHEQRGGLGSMGRSIQRGMVLIFSIWNDAGGFMQWLDGGDRGPCNTTEGNPALIQKNHPEVSVTYSNIKWGEIGSTFSAGPSKCKRRTSI